MAVETALVIASLTVPTVLEMLGKILNINKDRLERYYEASNAFRQYVNSLTTDVQQELKDREFKYTPSTAPRNDYAWITDEIKKRQDVLFNLNKEIRLLNEKESINQQQNYVGSDEYWEHGAKAVGSYWADQYKKNGKLWHKESPLSAALHSVDEAEAKDKFKKNKADRTQKNNLELIKLNQQKADLARPLVNNNPTYMSVQERLQKKGQSDAQSKKQK